MVNFSKVFQTNADRLPCNCQHVWEESVLERVLPFLSLLPSRLCDLSVFLFPIPSLYLVASDYHDDDGGEKEEDVIDYSGNSSVGPF